jgi:flagellar motor switch protein FliG
MAQKRELTNEEKAAVMLASLDPKLAATVMQQLPPKTMLRVTAALRSLGVVTKELRDQALNECVRGVQEFAGAVQGDETMANALLTQAVGEKKATALLAENQAAAKTAFSDLVGMAADQVATLISLEQPGVIALVLKHLPPAMSAEILEVLPSETRRRTIVLMCTYADPAEDVVVRVEALISAKVSGSRKAAKKSGDGDRLTAVTAILQHTSRAVEEDLLGAVQENSEALATQIRDRLFTFEDIARLNDVAMRRLMQEIDMGALATALRNANVDLRERFFRNMSKRAAQGLKEEMEFAQKLRLTDVEAKQREIVDTVRRLDSEGQISIGSSDEYV